MQRPFTRFVGVDLGGARGKTTVVAHLSARGDGGVIVDHVATRAPASGGAPPAPWRDATLAEHLASLAGEPVVVAVDAALTAPSCGRCVRPACPGAEACDEPAVAWLRTEAAERSPAVAPTGARAGAHEASPRVRLRLLPYAHRATEVVCLRRGLSPPTALGRGLGPIAARAGHLVRRLAGAGLHLHERLLEVSSAATVAALRGDRAARGYKRDADPWQTRAEILAALPDLTFAAHSRLAREDTLRNDHCFDAIVAGYTAFLWARDGWALPAGWDALAADGWIWTPPARPA